MKKEKILKIIFILLPFILAFPAHFIYEYIPFPLFAIYFPVNESIFEHTKLLFTPIITSYLIFYLIYKKNINVKKYLSSLLISILVSTITMLTFYYMFFAFSKSDVLILNILSLILGNILGQIIAIIFYKKNITWSEEISVFSLITLTTLFLILTINPPSLPFFFDKIKNGYGI